MSEPVTIKTLQRLAENRIQIAWSDGQTCEYTASQLRQACPCATCREKKSAPPKPSNQLTVLSAEETKPLTIRGMRPVGAYAYNIAFSDGHGSGLFTLERLRALGDTAED